MFCTVLLVIKKQTMKRTEIGFNRQRILDIFLLDSYHSSETDNKNVCLLLTIFRLSE